MSKIRLLLAVFAAVVVALPGLAGASGPRHVPVFWVDLAGTAKQHPDVVYFTADAGGQVSHVKWRHWGRARTVGRGTFLNTAPTPPGQDVAKGPAKMIAWKPILCVPDFGSKKGKVIRVYRHVRLLYPDGKGGRRWGDVSARAGYLACR